MPSDELLFQECQKNGGCPFSIQWNIFISTKGLILHSLCLSTQITIIESGSHNIKKECQRDNKNDISQGRNGRVVINMLLMCLH